MPKKPANDGKTGVQTKLISARIPLELYNAIAAIEKKKGTNRTDILVQALRADLSAIADEVIKQRMEDLKKKLEQS